MSSAYRSPDDGGVVAELRARRLAELDALVAAHGAVVEVYARRAGRIAFGATLLATSVTLASHVALVPTTIAGWLAAATIGAIARGVAPAWLRARCERRFAEEQDVVVLERHGALELARELTRGLERLSVAAPLIGVLAMVPLRVVPVVLAVVGWRFAGKLAASRDLAEGWKEGWWAVVWCGAAATVAALIDPGQASPVLVGLMTAMASTLFLPWLFDGAATLVAHERKRLG